MREENEPVYVTVLPTFITSRVAGASYSPWAATKHSSHAIPESSSNPHGSYFPATAATGTALVSMPPAIDPDKCQMQQAGKKHAQILHIHL